MVLKKIKTMNCPGTPELTFFGILKNDGHIVFKKGDVIEAGISEKDFRNIKKLGKKSLVTLSTLEGHGHIEYWSVDEFSSWEIEKIVSNTTVTTFKGK